MWDEQAGIANGFPCWHATVNNPSLLAQQEQADISVEHAVDGLAHHLGIKVSVSFPLLFGLMAHPFINQTLIYAFACQNRNEAMTKHVKAVQHPSLGTGQRPFEMIVSLSLCQSALWRNLSQADIRPAALLGTGSGLLSLIPSCTATFLAASDCTDMAKQERSARMNRKPILEYTSQEGC